MTVPAMTPVTSTTIHSIGHDGQHLYVRFKRGDMMGSLYRYPDVAPAHVDALTAHESPGGYFQQHIRGNHKGEMIA